jgi:2-oxoglutarate ferredoxin oxidoreductase subunit beta
VNLKILLFNNQIYGLTKGQYSPTSEEGKVTKSSPFGSVDHQFNPIAVALGAEATFVARTMDNDRQHLTDVLRQAVAHQGTAFIEIYQNCNVFNDGAFDVLREKPQGVHNQIRLVHGEPIVFDEGTRCVVVGENGRLVIANTADVPADSIVVHDMHGRPSLAFALAHLSHGPTEPTAIGVFREFERPVYGQAMNDQLARATERLGKGDVGALLHSGDTWTVS